VANDADASLVPGTMFIARLSVRRIDVRADGTVDVELADRGMFRGHSMIVTVDAGRTITDIDLVG
jgi:hypothetical protein